MCFLFSFFAVLMQIACAVLSLPLTCAEGDLLLAEPQFGGNTINPIGVILWLVHGFGILAMSAF